jgi:hypothetical protein
MLPGPANILKCPFCSGKKEVMSLISGNTCGATVWSDTRRNYPMLPEISPIQQCPHCSRYYFIEQAEQEYGSQNSYSSELGKLTFDQLKDAKQQFESVTLTDTQTRVINHQLFMAYNDKFQRPNDNLEFEAEPSEEDLRIFENAINELIKGLDSSEDSMLFHAELLRELGKFSESKALLSACENHGNQWIVDKMLKHVEAHDKRPFLLFEDGIRIE